jgi:hypothetical protein
MVKSGRSVYIESSLWIKLEKYAEENGFPDISSALEHILKKALGEKS